MIRSMTGYGAAQLNLDGWSLTVECRSVNQKALEIKTYLPRGLSALEPAVQGNVKSVISRGRVDVRVDLQRESSSDSAIVNVEKFATVARQLKALATELSLSPPSVSDVLSFRDVLAATDSADDIDVEPVKNTVHEALAQLVAAREEEGTKLATTMRALVSSVQDEVGIVERTVPEVVDDFRSRLETRVTEALAKFGVAEIDEQRMIQEVVVYADRSDIAEEVQRTRSHLQKLLDLLESASDEPCGKRMDFYLQELFREANTMGSKSSAVVLTDSVVRIKSAIEQMREQAANIE
jgi:uncharacterized protein (TIGR00255 family)